MRIAILSALFFLFTLQIIQAQDTLVDKTVNTREYDLKAYGQKLNLLYEDCNKINPASDTSFYAGEKLNSKLVLYKDIRHIDIQSDNRRTWEGVWKGRLTGGLAGIMAMTFFNETLLPTSKIEGGGDSYSL